MKVSRHAKIIELISQYDIETQEELADGICDVTTISRLENNRHALSDELRIKLLERLQLPC